MKRVAVLAEGLGKRYSVAHRSDTDAHARRSRFRLPRTRPKVSRDDFWAIRDVSFEVPEGEVFGIIGANGAGKSTLLKVLARITEPTEGYAEIRGRVGSLLEVGTGFHPDLSGRDNVYLNGAILGMKRTEIARRFDEIVGFAGVASFIDVPVKWYSSGMYVRLAFAVAAHLDPEILIVDEVLSVGDLEFQRKCLGRMDEIASGGRTVLFVSHNLTSVSTLCSSGCLLEGGRLVESGTVERVIERYVASTRHEAALSVADRTDRQGTGMLRFTAVETGSGSTVQVGEEVRFRLDYEAKRPLGNVMVGAAVYGVMGEPLFVCSTKVTGQEFRAVPAQGSFFCTVPRFPLAPGSYSINIYAEVDGEIADWIENAHAFEVVGGNFFGSGQLPPSSHGQFVVDHQWSVSDEQPRLQATDSLAS